MRYVCDDLLDAVWGLALCRISVVFAQIFRDGFGFVVLGPHYFMQ